MDQGLHVVCAHITEDFLEFSKSRGNDLSTPRNELNFPGLKEGDHWCVCAERWKEAYENNKAPKIYLRRTNKKSLKIIDLEILKKYAIDLGIKESKGEIIIATDADCRVGSLWVASMTYSLINKNGVIIGYSDIDDKRGTFFEDYEELDVIKISGDAIQESARTSPKRTKKVDKVKKKENMLLKRPQWLKPVVS